MVILKTILYILLCLLLVVLLIILLFLIIPFKYSGKLINENDERFSFSLKYLFFRFEGVLSFKPKFLIRLVFGKKVLFDSSVKKVNNKKDSIAETDFIQNKDLEKEITVDKKDIKKLFSNVANYEKNIKKVDENEIKEKEKKKEQIDKADKLIDKFKLVLPKDLIYVIKRIIKEAIIVFEKIAPNHFDFQMKLSDSDPYKSGVIMSLVAPLYAIMGDDIKFDINKQNVNLTTIGFSGSPILITLIKPLISLILDKKVRNFIFKK